MDDNRLEYLSVVKALVDRLDGDEAPLLLAANWCATAVAGGGLVHLFGAGHSHIAAEEPFNRAGGLVPVNAVLVKWLMLHEGDGRATLLERQPGLGEIIIGAEPVERGDVFFVVSNSGRNAVPVEVAEAAKARGAKVVAVTSLEHSENVKARGSRGVKLADVADLVLDNHAPLGDATITVQDGLKTGGVSTIMALVIIQTVLVAAVKILAEQGIQPPVFKSFNVDGSEEWNTDQLRRLGHRVPTLLRYTVP